MKTAHLEALKRGSAGGTQHPPSSMQDLMRMQLDCFQVGHAYLV
jgi:hypothetical protein